MAHSLMCALRNNRCRGRLRFWFRVTILLGFLHGLELETHDDDLPLTLPNTTNHLPQYLHGQQHSAVLCWLQVYSSAEVHHTHDGRTMLTAVASCTATTYTCTSQHMDMDIYGYIYIKPPARLIWMQH